MGLDLRFPIGEFITNFEVTLDLRQSYIDTIANLPNDLAKAVDGLDDEQLDTKYRPEGWTIRQVIHHVADSHLNSYCRFKLAMTEDLPTIRAYDEASWAELADNKMPVEISMKIIEGIHGRWAVMLKSMSDVDFKRELIHPDSGKWTLDKFLGLYVWHSKHHLAHITALRERKGW